MLLKRSEATADRRRIPVVMVSSADGITPTTGLTFSAGDIKVTKNGAAEANHAGTVTELTGGRYYYQATEAELDTLGFLMVAFVKAGSKTFNAAAQVVSFDPYDPSALGLTATPVTVTSPVAASGTLTLVRGDDYFSADLSRAILFSSSSWPNLAGALAVTLTVRTVATLGDALLFTKGDSGALRVVGLGAQTVGFEPTYLDTAGVVPGTRTMKYDVQATLANGHIVTLAYGTCNGVEDQTRP